MGDRAFLPRLRQILNDWFGLGVAKRGTEHDLHSAHTVLAPPPPGGMRRVLPKPNPRAVQAAQAAPAPELPESATDPVESQLAPPVHRGRENIGTLLARGYSAQALSVFAACVKLEHGFLADADTVLPLARRAMAEGKPALALRAAQRFDVLYPGHSAVAEVILLSAQAMLALGRPAAARQLVAAFRLYFPGHPLATQAETLAQRIG